MNKNKIQTISCLVLFLLVFNLPSFAYVERSRSKILLDIRGGAHGSSEESFGKLGAGLGIFFRERRKNRKLTDYIKTCNDPLLDALEPEDAMKLIIEKGIKCPGKKITNKAK